MSKNADDARRLGAPATEPERHTGGNAEECPACDGRTDLPYPWICPGDGGSAARASQATTGPHSPTGGHGAAPDPAGGGERLSGLRATAKRRILEALDRWHEVGLFGTSGEFAGVMEAVDDYVNAAIPAIRAQAIHDLDAGQVTAEELAAAGCETSHIVDLRDDGWTIRHPLSCRPGLFECPVNRAAERTLIEPPTERGAFTCTTDGNHFVIGDRIARGDA